MQLRFGIGVGVLSCLLLRCTSVPETPAADGGGPGGLSSCGVVSGRCPLPDAFQLRALLDAASFGADARFAAMGGRTVLVSAPGQPARVVQLDVALSAGAQPGSHTVFNLPDAALTVIDVADDGASGPESQVFALACRTQTQCSLWQSGATRGGELSEVPGSELAFRPRGLAIDHSATPAVSCVFGPGLQCFDGAWTQPLAAAADVEIEDAAFSRDLGVVVGAGAQVWIRTQARGPWQSHAVTPAAFPLSGLDVQDKLGAVVGPKGELVVVQADMSWVCQSDAELALAAPSGSSLTSVTLVSKAGRVLRTARMPGADFCESQQLEIGEILATSRVQCGASANIWLMTAHAIWGELTCLEVP